MFTRVVFLLLLLVPALAYGVPLLQRFGPQPSIDVPEHLEGYSDADPNRFELELAQRLQRLPDDPGLSHKLGKVLFHRGKSAEAERVWRRASSLDPNLAPADVMLAVEEVFMLLGKGDTETAMGKLKSVEERFADSPHFSMIRGEQAARTGNLDQAVDAYRKAVALAPDLYITHLNLARLYERLVENKLARIEYELAVSVAPERASVWNFLGAHQFREGLQEPALSSFRRSEKADENGPMAEVQMAMMSLEIHDLLGARYWYRRALTRNPAEPNPIRVVLGDVLLRLDRYDEARQEIQAVLSEEELPPLLAALGYIFETEGELEAAEQQYRKALALQPSNVLVANNLAMLLVRMDKNAEEALQFAVLAKNQQPQNSQILGTHACALYHAGQLDEALDALARAVRISPSDAWARYCYGKSLYEAKQYEAGKIHLEGALILDHEFARASEIRELVEKY